MLVFQSLHFTTFLLPRNIQLHRAPKSRTKILFPRCSFRSHLSGLFIHIATRTSFNNRRSLLTFWPSRLHRTWPPTLYCTTPTADGEERTLFCMYLRPPTWYSFRFVILLQWLAQIRPLGTSIYYVIVGGCLKFWMMMRERGETPKILMT